jgi:hypothetical protein
MVFPKSRAAASDQASRPFQPPELLFDKIVGLEGDIS